MCYIQVKCPETYSWSESRYVREADDYFVSQKLEIINCYYIYYYSNLMLNFLFFVSLLSFSVSLSLSLSICDIMKDEELGVNDDITANITLGNVASGRSESFAAIFLITLFLGLSLGLAVYAGALLLRTK